MGSLSRLANACVQPRRLMIAPDAVVCKRLLGNASHDGRDRFAGPANEWSAIVEERDVDSGRPEINRETVNRWVQNDDIVIGNYDGQSGQRIQIRRYRRTFFRGNYGTA
jgi:hypothetical protein